MMEREVRIAPPGVRGGEVTRTDSPPDASAPVGHSEPPGVGRSLLPWRYDRDRVSGDRTPARLIGLVAVLGALALWELADRLQLANPVYFKGPLEVFPRLVELLAEGTLLHHTAATMTRIALGTAIGAPFGFALAVLAGTILYVEWVAHPIVELVRAVPPLALLPVFLLFFGLGLAFPVAVVFWVTWVPVFLNTLQGMRHVRTSESEVVDAALIDGAGGFTLARTMIVPLAAPYVLVGVRLAVGGAFLVIVAAEIMGTPTGLGYYILDSSQTFHITEMYAAIVWMGVLAWACNTAIEAVARLVMPKR